MTQKQIAISIWFEEEKKHKTFIAPRTNAKTLYEAFELDEKAAAAENAKDIVKSLNERIKFIVRVFQNQFTFDQFLEGFQSFEIADAVRRIMMEVMGFKTAETKEEKDFLQEVKA
ncbi:hypothetical protein BACPU_11600 [Bacillus pumilus]|nr:hypothetical protein BACPU_11600 [Bacillus pumilus]